MPLVAVLRWRAGPSGAAHAALDDRRLRPAEGVLSPAARAVLVERCARALERRFPEVAPPGGRAEVGCATAEAEAGRALADAVRAVPLVAWSLAAFLERASAEGGPAVLAVDADDGVPDLRALPWELLASPGTSVPLEEGGLAVVARIAPGRVRPDAVPRRGPVRVLRWSPTPGDPECALRLFDLDLHAALLGLDRPWDIDPASTAPPPAEPGTRDVIHVVCHGEADLGQATWLTQGGPHPPSEAAHLLGTRLAGAALAVLDVCEGGHPTRTEREGLATRLVAAGAPLVAAPVAAVGVEAARAFSHGLYAALAAGGSAVEAVAAGRRAVRALARPRPDSRWSSHALYAGDVEALAAPGARGGWLPLGCPPPAPDAAALLDRAAARARDRDDGYVGVEHLLLAEGGLPKAVSDDHPARRLLAELDDAFHRRPASLERAPGRREDLAGTPRLRTAVRVLAPGFRAESLWAAVADRLVEGHPAPRARDSSETTWTEGAGTRKRTTRPGPPPAPAAPPGGLRVLGGPEDGRLLRPRAGDVVGRAAAAGGPSLPLYSASYRTDRALGRRALAFESPVEVRPHRAVRLLRGHRATQVNPPLPGAPGLELRVGDVLVLAPATRLQVVGHAPPLSTPAEGGENL